MKFTNPAFLFALFAIAIPIIIHLFNFRKFKRVYFTNVKFLKEIKQETQSKAKLKHLFVLACRILAISFLVFAFAQPYIPQAETKTIQGPNAVSIFIDNSFSMNALSKNGTLLDEAKKRAREIANAYQATDQFQLLTNDFEGRHQRLTSKEDLFELIEEVKISPSVKSVHEIFSRQQDQLNNSQSTHKKSYIISDFQIGISDFTKIKPDTNITSILVPLSAQERKNIYIDSCWFKSPVIQLNKNEELNIRIKNKSDNPLENNSVKLFINDQQRTPASFSIQPNSSADITLSFSIKESGTHFGYIELNDYPVTFDDKLYFSFTVPKHIKILAISPSEKALNNNESYINSLFGKDSLFELKEIQENKIDYSALKKNHLIIIHDLKTISTGLAQELKRFVVNGGNLLVFPSGEADLDSYKEFLSSLGTNYLERLDTLNTKVSQLNYDHEIFKDVFEKQSENIDLPYIYSHYIFSQNVRSGEEFLMKLSNENTLLSKYDIEKGKVFLSSVPLSSEYSTFPKHALFVPTLYQIAVFSSATQSKLFYTIGNDEPMEVRGNIPEGDAVYHISGFKNNFDVIPEHKIIDSKSIITTHNQIRESGNYALYYGEELISGISFNYNRMESDLNCLSPEDLIKQINLADLKNFKLIEPGSKSLTQTLSEMDEGVKLWKLCIILALIFLALEILLLRFWKN